MGILPPTWKTLAIHPVVKSGKPVDQIISFRSISLTSCSCKLFERLVHRRLSWLLETYNVFPEQLSGFRRDRTTADAIGDLVMALETAKYGRMSAAPSTACLTQSLYNRSDIVVHKEDFVPLCGDFSLRVLIQVCGATSSTRAMTQGIGARGPSTKTDT